MLLLEFQTITELVEIISICVINLYKVFAKVIDIPIEEINKIVSFVLCELFESFMDGVPILLVSDNVNKLIYDVVMSNDIWNQELELNYFCLQIFFLILLHLDFFITYDHISTF